MEGVVCVDFAGRAVAMDKLRKIANKYNFWIIEDACHVPGGSYRNENGNTNVCGDPHYADISIFFHAAKHITTCEGGVVLTNNNDLAKKIKLLRSHGLSKMT